jgi:hypothetical protein
MTSGFGPDQPSQDPVAIPPPPAWPEAAPGGSLPQPPPNRRPLVIGLIVGGVVVVGAIVLAVALSGGGKGPATLGGSTSTVPAGWTVHRDESSGFAIAFPGSWVDATEKTRALIPQYKEFFKFAVADSSTGANVNVVVEDSGVLDIDGYAGANERTLLNAGATDIAKSTVSTPAGTAMVFSYRAGPNASGAPLTQYFLVHGGRGYVVTFTGASGSTFDLVLMRQFMNSFELLD